jgi:hypothetical protein
MGPNIEAEMVMTKPCEPLRRFGSAALLVCCLLSCTQKASSTLKVPPLRIAVMKDAAFVGSSRPGSNVWIIDRPFQEVSSAARSELKADEGWQVLDSPRSADRELFFRNGRTSLEFVNGAMDASYNIDRSTTNRKTSVVTRGFK